MSFGEEMKIAANVIDLIGGTPLVQLNRVTKGAQRSRGCQA